MLRFKRFVLVLLMVAGISVVFAQTPFDEGVQKAVNNQLATYPHATLQDIYKNFFQDRFGPGHLLTDTARAGAYLRHELQVMGQTTAAYYEPTGWQGNFFRVNLSVIKENRIAYASFFDAFVRSVNSIRPVPIEVWQQEWHAIDAIIAGMRLTLPSYEADRQAIFDLLKKQEYVMHHSELFQSHYSPHYRIISKEIFENEIRPHLPSCR